jgi:hypothetical protein
MSRPLTPAERGRRGGLNRGDALTPAELSDIGRAGAAAANSPEAKARSIGRAWADLSDERRADVLDILRDYGVI